MEQRGDSPGWDALGAQALAVMLFVVQSPGTDGGWSRAELDRAGGGGDWTADLIATDEQIEGGWQGWLVPFGDDYTLTPWGAEQSRRCLIERAEEYPTWTDFLVDDRGNRIVPEEPTFLKPRRGEKERPLPAPLRAVVPAPHLAPDYEAIMGEAVACLKLAASLAESEPDEAEGWRRKAEEMVGGEAEELGKRWMFDPVSGLPRIMMGQPVPVDRRMGPRQAG